jgi:hypothetical protein
MLAHTLQACPSAAVTSLVLLTGLPPPFTEFRRTSPFTPDIVTIPNCPALKGKTMHRYIQHREIRIHRGRNRRSWGILLIVLGCLFLLDRLSGWTFATTWPIILIALGVKAVAGGMISLHRQSRKESAQ